MALIQAMEFAVDPNGDGNTQDHVDIVNMSLGGGYGQPFDDALSTAVDNATKLGVLTVAAAGNGGDRPYITGTPAAAATAISVAQTQMPSAFLPSISVIEPAAFKGEYRAVFQPWSAPLNRGIQGLVQYGNGAGGNLNGCTPFGEGSLEGKIVVVDRGACFFSSKIRHIQVGGGDLGIIARVDPGTPFPGGFGGGSPITIPAYMVNYVRWRHPAPGRRSNRNGSGTGHIPGRVSGGHIISRPGVPEQPHQAGAIGARGFHVSGKQNRHR